MKSFFITSFSLFLMLFGVPAMASDILVSDAYARASSPNAKVGAAFMVINNLGETDDRLVGVTSEVAAKTELHTHIQSDAGIMQMRPLGGGVEIQAKSVYVLERGGNHVMFMGLNEGFEQGDVIIVTLLFEHAGKVVAEIPVDFDR